MQCNLQIGFYTQAPAVTSGELLFTIPPTEALITIGQAQLAPSYRLPPTARPVNQPLGPSLTLLGASWPDEPVPAQTDFPLDLYWQINQPLPANTQLHVGLLDETGTVAQAWFNLTLAETFNPEATTWQPGDLIHTHWQLDLLPEALPGKYHFELVQAEDTDVTLPFGQLIVSEH